MRAIFQKTWIVTLAVVLAALWIPQALLADENGPKERTVRVQGEGKVTAVPDQAEIILTVQEEGTVLKEVSDKAGEKMKKVFQTMTGFGIPGKDIRTISYNTQPKYRYDKGEAQKTGYTVSNRIRIQLKDLSLSGKVLDAVSDLEVAQVEGPSFGFSEPQKLQIEALKAAVEDAHAKAEALAQSADAQLGKVLTINQTSSSMPIPRPMAFKGADVAMGGNEVPISTGENDVTAQVEVIYLLK